jgi:hypothetical protein
VPATGTLTEAREAHFVAQISKRTTASGEARYDVRSRIGGRVVTKTFRRRKDANAYATVVEADKLRGIVMDPRGPRTPFGEVATNWLGANATKRPRVATPLRLIGLPLSL